MRILFFLTCLVVPLCSTAQSANTIAVKGLGFTLNDKPFQYTGISFFNAMYNSNFNKDDGSRNMWLNKLRSSGVNVIRIWGQWDNTRGFVDTCPTCTIRK